MMVERRGCRMDGGTEGTGRRSAVQSLPPRPPLRGDVVMDDSPHELVRDFGADEAAFPVAIELAEPEEGLPARAEVAAGGFNEPAEEAIGQAVEHNPASHAKTEHRFGGPAVGDQLGCEPEHYAAEHDAHGATDREVLEDIRAGLGDEVEGGAERTRLGSSVFQRHVVLLPAISTTRPATSTPRRARRSSPPGHLPTFSTSTSGGLACADASPPGPLSVLRRGGVSGSLAEMTTRMAAA